MRRPSLLNGISIPGHEANSARSFELFAQLVRIALHDERANLRGVEDAPFALILAANQRLAATQHRISRLHRAKRRLGLRLTSRGGKLHHEAEAACLDGARSCFGRGLQCRPAKLWGRARDRLSDRVAVGLPSQGGSNTN